MKRRAMVQTALGAALNPWIRHLKACARAYHAQKAERANLPKRRLTRKSPDEDLYVKPPAAAAQPADPPRRRLTRKSPGEAPRPPAPAAMAPQGAPRPAISPERALPMLGFAAAGRRYLESLASKRATAARFYQELAAVGDLKKALREAGLPARSSIASFVRAFPEFRLEVPPNGGTPYVSLR